MTVKISKPAINVREELADLKKPTGIAGEAMLRAETPQEQFNLIGAGRRNIIINGGFDIFQRGSGPISGHASNSVASADRWVIPSPSSISEVVDNDRASHLKKMFKVTASSSGYGQIAQWVEDVRTFSDQIITVSFWAKSPNAGTFRFHIYQHMGSGGSPSTVSVIDDASYLTIKQANTWQRFETTIHIPSVGSATIGASSFTAIQFGANSGIANRIMYYSEVQVELGKVATPFEHRSYGEELALCQRYFWNGGTNKNYWMYDISDHGSSSGLRRGNVYFPVPMRVTPSISTSVVFSSGSYTSGVDSGDWVSPNHTSIYANSVSSGVYAYARNISADAEL